MPRRSQGSGSLFKRGDGYWVGQVDIGGEGSRRRKSVVSKDRGKALAKLRALQKEIDAGRVPTAPSTTVSAWLDYWHSHIATAKGLKPGTLKGYANIIRLYLKPYIGHKRLDKLTAADIRGLYKRLQEEPSQRLVKGSTRNAQKADQVLRLALKVAVKEGVLGYSPLDRVDPPKHTKKEQQAFTYEVAEHIVKTAERHSGEMWAARWLAGFWTGLRESELLGLTWDYIDFTTNRIHVEWQLQKLDKTHGCGKPTENIYPCGMKRVSACPQAYWKFPPGLDYRHCGETNLVWTRPKSVAGKRLVPMVEPLTTSLKVLKKHDGVNPHNLVFHHSDGSPIRQDQDQRAWKQLLKDAGVDHAPQHTIRHSTVTILTKRGADPHIVQRVIGHSNILVTRSYQHDDEEDAENAWGVLAPARD